MRGSSCRSPWALTRLSPTFGTLYVHFGRPSIPPERLLRALLLQALYSLRSERQLMEPLDFNLLFRWSVGLGMDDAVWSPTTLGRNRDRLLDGDIAQAFFEAVRRHADTERLLMTVTPHIAQHTTKRRSAIAGRTTRHPGYAISQQKRKRVEQGFGWMKTIGGLRKLPRSST